MKNRYFSKMTHIGRPRQEVTGFFRIIVFFVPTVFLLFTNDCWFTSEYRKCILYLFLLKIHSLLYSELYTTNCILSASALVLLDNIVVADPS